MMLPTPRSARLAIAFARFLAFVTASIGGVALANWHFNIPAIDAVLPHLNSMAPNGAVGVLLAGIGLFCLTFVTLRAIAWAIAFLLVLLGAATVSQELFRVDLGIDRALLLGADLLTGAAQPRASARMDTGLASVLILFGLALLSAKGDRLGNALSQILAVAMLAQALIVITGQVYGVSSYEYPFPFTAMTSYGLLCGILLALGLISASPEFGIAEVILEPSPAGEMLRRLLPGLLIVPVVIGWFAHRAEEAGFYDSSATLALFAVSSIVVLAAFAWTTIDAVRRADIARNQALIELRGQREWLSTTVSSINEGVIATDPAGNVLLVNRIAEELTGWPMAEMRGRPIWEVLRVIDESSRQPVDGPALKALREGAMTDVETAVLVTRVGAELPIENSGAPILSFDGSIAGSVVVFRDITERKRTAQRQNMLVGELNHRVKNVLAIVQSLVQASLNQASGKPAQAMAQTLSERLRALHRAHDLLLDSQWSGANLRAMVERELEPYHREGGPEIQIKGSEVLLPPHCTSIFAMTLHELATNAVKYGALSSPSGKLSISWRNARNRLHLAWEERGQGAAAGGPGRGRKSGFGMQLIDKGIRHNLGGDTKVEFRPAGLYVELNVPLEPAKQTRKRAAPAAPAVTV